LVGQGFDLACFTVDWEAEQVRCPHGKTSTQWLTHKDRHGNPCVSVRFARADCQACPVKAACTKGENMGRQLGLRPRAQFEALQVARTRQTTEEFKQQYVVRAGIEATISQGVRTGELRRSRYRGQAKTHLQHVLMAVALNLGRLAVWWQEQIEGPLRSIRPPRFATLANSGQSIGLAGAG
jgi:transposase